MPCKVSSVMKERLCFVGRPLDGESMSDVWEFGKFRYIPQDSCKIYSR